MKISIAANQQNQFQLLKIKQQLPELLATLCNKAEIWQSLFELKIALQQDNAAEVLAKLQKLETEISPYNDVYLSAVLNRALYYAFIRNNIIDVALDIAIKNKKQWLQLAKYYSALEMEYNITNIRVTLMMDPSSESLINNLEEEVIKLEADLYFALITEIKAIWYTRKGNPQQAYDIVNQALQDQNFTLSDNAKINLTSLLASISYQLKNYDHSISLLNTLLLNPNLISIEKIKQTHFS